MDFVVLTIFPEMVEPFYSNGMIKRAVERKLISGAALNIRDYAYDRHQSTDDKPYGGGCGMVMKPEPLKGAIEAAEKISPKARKILMTPQGRKFNQGIAKELSQEEGLILVCGRYEGVDERVGANYIDDEISIGDFVLTGGELGAMTIIDAVARLIPGVLGGETSAEQDSFSNGLLEYAHYTRPEEFDGQRVPDVLLSGNHARIEEYREKTSLIRTFLKRPDLLAVREFSRKEKEILRSWCKQIETIINM